MQLVPTYQESITYEVIPTISLSHLEGYELTEMTKSVCAVVLESPCLVALGFDEELGASRSNATISNTPNFSTHNFYLLGQCHTEAS